MPVFKLSLKIIKKNLPEMFIYIIIFLAISLVMAVNMTNQTQSQSLYSNNKINVAFISKEESPLIDGFKDNLREFANFVNIEDNKEALSDALYFRSIEYIIRVPKGFTESFMIGEPIKLEKTVVPSSYSAAYIDIAIDQYFNTARLYVDGMPGISQQQLVKNVKNDLGYSLPIDFQNDDLAQNSHEFARNYFNFIAYSLFAVLILGISTVLLVLNEKNNKMRNTCAPISTFRMNLEFLLAHLTFTFVAWLFMIVLYLIFDNKNIFNLNTVYFMINAFIFTLCASSISYFIGNLVKSERALSAICNVVSLGPSFISGVFVPQEFLGANVLKIASFTPTYWFVKANDVISDLTTFDFTHLQPVMYYMLIEIGFAVAFLSVALVINKKRRVSY